MIRGPWYLGFYLFRFRCVLFILNFVFDSSGWSVSSFGAGFFRPNNHHSPINNKMEPIMLVTTTDISKRRIHKSVSTIARTSTIYILLLTIFKQFYDFILQFDLSTEVSYLCCERSDPILVHGVSIRRLSASSFSRSFSTCKWFTLV